MKVKSGLVVEALPEGGCLVVDESTKQSHALRPEAAGVWRCVEQGQTEVAAIAKATAQEPEMVEAAMAELSAVGLIDEAPSSGSRREWLARAATVAGAAVGIKLIETIVTPSPAAAQSMVDGSQQDGG